MSVVLQGTLHEGCNGCQASRTFLTLRAGHGRLTASIAREHEAMREALAALRQVSSPQSTLSGAQSSRRSREGTTLPARRLMVSASSMPSARHAH